MTVSTSMKTLAIVGGLAFLCAHRAEAAVTICNHSRSTITVAIAHGQKDAPGTSTGGDLGVTAEGWWDVTPGNCTEVSAIDAGNNWLYYHAKSPQGVVEGTSMLCVTRKAFNIGQQFRHSGETCRNGQYLLGFKRVDTAKPNHTINVT